jgi:hypothetical protein
VAGLDDDARTLLTGLIGQLTDVASAIGTLLGAPAPKPSARAGAARASGAPREPARAVSAPPATSEHPSLRAGAARMLAAMGSYHPVSLTRAQLATVSKMKSTGGTYSTYLSNLRAGGMFEEVDGRLRLTAAGLAALGTTRATPLTAQDVREQWRGSLRAGAARMFDVLVELYPAPCTRAELAGAVDMEPSGGTFSTYLSILRSNGLVVTRGSEVVASPTLFLEPGAG